MVKRGHQKCSRGPACLVKSADQIALAEIHNVEVIEQFSRFQVHLDEGGVSE